LCGRSGVHAAVGGLGSPTSREFVPAPVRLLASEVAVIELSVWGRPNDGWV
jgi:hypothetical protein